MKSIYLIIALIVSNFATNCRADLMIIFGDGSTIQADAGKETRISVFASKSSSGSLDGVNGFSFGIDLFNDGFNPTTATTYFHELKIQNAASFLTAAGSFAVLNDNNSALEPGAMDHVVSASFESKNFSSASNTFLFDLVFTPNTNASTNLSGLGGVVDEFASYYTQGTNETKITNFSNASIQFSSVPEPSSFVLLTLGSAGGLLWLRRKRKGFFYRDKSLALSSDN